MVREDLTALEDPEARGLRECDPRQWSPWRINQCCHPSDRDRRTDRRSHDARRLGSHWTRHPHNCRPYAVGPLPDGGFLLRWRASGRDQDARRAQAAALRRAHGHRKVDCGKLQRRSQLESGSDPPHGPSPGRTRRSRGPSRQPCAGWSCSQTLRRVATPHAPSRPGHRLSHH